MTNDRAILEKACALDTFAMEYETAVYALRAGDYLADFYDTFRVRKNRSCRLIPHPETTFRDALRELSGESVWLPIAEETERLFGTPSRVTALENDGELREELGPRGYAPFFFVFDVMFCEYDAFTLCFFSGTNN